MNIPIITNLEIVEGLTASIFFPLAILLFKHLETKSFFFFMLISWFLTWLLRKASVHIYDQYKKKYNLVNTLHSITI
jgi:phosphoglycerol transferase MdoB-like AlkP superfamily enzyme